MLSRGSHVRRAVAALVVAVSTTAGLLVAAPGAQARSTTPGSLTGYAFDTCSAPAQDVMDAWWQASPYSAVGIYVGGSSTKCAQPELTPSWVRAQVRTGWHLLPLWVGPQASCSGYADTMSADLATAGQQGRAQAAAAVAAAQGLGIRSGSTLYYDLEDYDIAPDDCRRSALTFLSGWTDALHAAGYQSGVYSNIAAAITSLDYANVASPGSYSMPDDIWFAWANNKPDTVTDQRVLSDAWDDHARIHQYALGVQQSFGGYALTVDTNWVDVGKGSVAPRPRSLCSRVDVDLRRYPVLRQGSHGPAVEAAQCLLRHQHATKAPITGRYDAGTAAAVRSVQRKLHLRQTGVLSRQTWATVFARGSQPLLKVGATGDPVFRVQRALTAALGRTTKINGRFDPKTAKAVTKYQRRHHLDATGVVTSEVWDSLLGAR